MLTMMCLSMSDTKGTIGSILADATKTYFVPLGWLGALLKARDFLPPWTFYLLLGGLPLYIGYQLYRRYRIERTRRQRMNIYESLVRLLRTSDIDQAFTYHTLYRRLVVTRPNASLTSIEKGRNTSGRNQNQLTRFLSGDSPLEFGNLGFTASILTAGQRHSLTPTAETYEGGRRFVVHLPLVGKVIRPDDEIEITSSFCWPGAVARDQDYWVFPLHLYTNPIGRLEMECLFDTAPNTISLVELSDEGETPLPLSGPLPDSSQGPQPFHKYSASITAPKGTHVIKWHFGK
jgi:hypothetical protein